MKRIYNALAIALVIAGLSACNSQTSTQKTEEKDTFTTNNNLEDLQGTYEYSQNGDTISLKLAVQNDSLIGDLTYALKEKDKNVGVFRGVIQDSLIVGEYYFQSEGMESKRETVLGMVPEGLIEGFGEVVDSEDGMRFVDKNNLRFDHGMVLKKK